MLMENKNTQKVTAMLFLLALIIGWRNIAFAFDLQSDNPYWKFVVITLGSLFILLNLSAFVGLYRAKKWGYTVAYIAVVFSAFFFGYCYIPFVSHLFFSYGYFSTIVINVLLLGFIAHLHKGSRAQVA